MARPDCIHPEEAFVLVGSALICELCESDVEVETTGLHHVVDGQLIPTRPAVTRSEMEEIETVLALLVPRADAAVCEGRREDALAMNLALQTIRNLINRVEVRVTQTMTATAPQGLRLICND